MPLAAFGGRRDVMKHLAPLGAVYQAGTLSGNPVAVACGLATLSLVQAPNFYSELAQTATSLVTGLTGVATRQARPSALIASAHVRLVLHARRAAQLCRSDGCRQDKFQ